MNSRLPVILVVFVACLVVASPAAFAQEPQAPDDSGLNPNPEEPQAPDDTCLAPGTPEFEEAGCDPGGDPAPEAQPEPGVDNRSEAGVAREDAQPNPARGVGSGGLEGDEAAASRVTGQSGGTADRVVLARTGLDIWGFALLGAVSATGGLSLLMLRRRGRQYA